MAAKKFIRNVSGRLTEIPGIVTSAGAGNDGDIPALDATGKLDTTLMPTGIAAPTITAIASEALTAGNLVNVYNNAGTANVRKADASTTGKEASGFVLAGFASSATATIYLEGEENASMSGMTPGLQFLSDTTPGATVSTAPSGTGKIVQTVGYAASATLLAFQPGVVIALA